MSREDLVRFSTQLATILAAGIPLAEGLGSIRDRMEDRESRLILEDLMHQVERGASFSESLDRHPIAFPEVYRETIRAGELSGSLDLVLSRLSAYMEWMRGMRSQIKQVLMYPAILFVVLAGLVVVLLTFVLPRIMTMFPGGETSLPKETRLVLALSGFLGDYGGFLLAGMLAGTAAFFAWIRRPAGRRRFHHWILHIPALGKLVRRISIASFASTASILHGSGCDMLRTLDVAARTCGNDWIASRLDAAAARVRNGATLSDALTSVEVGDSLLLQLVGVGERTGDLEACLHRLGEYYDQEIPRQVRKTLGLVEPALLVVAGIVVAFILLAAMLPIFDVYQSIGG